MVFHSLGRSEFSLKNFTLDSSLSEALAEQVLRAVSSAVAAVSDYRHNHLLVCFVVGEDLLESFRQRVEVTVPNCSVLKHLRLDLGECQVASIYTVVSLLSAILALGGEELVASGGHEVVDFVPSESVGVARSHTSLASALESSVKATTLTHSTR